MLPWVDVFGEHRCDGARAHLGKPQPATRVFWSGGERLVELSPRADAELAVRVGEMQLDRLQRDVERLRNLLVGAAFGGELRHTPLARGERLDAAQSRSARSAAGRVELGACLLRERPRAAALGQLEGPPERAARLGGRAAAP